MELRAVLEALAVVFNLAYVVLAIQEKVWCWSAGLVGAALSLFVFFEARLYGAMALQGVYIALMIYGWYQWRRGGEGGTQLGVSRMPVRWWTSLAVAGSLFALGLGLFLRYRTDAALAFWDAGTTSFSVVAQFMTSRKWIENWLVWIVVNVVYVGMLVSQALYLMAALYAVFTALAVLGFVKWRGSLETGPTTGAA